MPSFERQAVTDCHIAGIPVRNRGAGDRRVTHTLRVACVAPSRGCLTRITVILSLAEAWIELSVGALCGCEGRVLVQDPP